MKTTSRKPFPSPAAAAAAAVSASAASASGSVFPDPTANLLLLHPNLRSALQEVVMELENGLIPIRVYETFRSPRRQACLYAKGISGTRPWRSLHQYGLAVDFGLYIDGEFSWPTSRGVQPFWERLREIGEFYGLETGEAGASGVEGSAHAESHLQLAGQDIWELQAGVFPGGGDQSWWENLEANIRGWEGEPAAPDLSLRIVEPTPNPYPGVQGGRSRDAQ